MHNVTGYQTLSQTQLGVPLNGDYQGRHGGVTVSHGCCFVYEMTFDGTERLPLTVIRSTN
jgi:hypothetical protein